jgi:hypothetical protein
VAVGLLQLFDEGDAVGSEGGTKGAFQVRKKGKADGMIAVLNGDENVSTVVVATAWMRFEAEGAGLCG